MSEIPFENQPATKGDVASLGELMGNLLAESEKTLNSKIDKLDGKVDDLRDEMNRKFDKLFDAVQANTAHIKLLLPVVKVVAQLKEKVLGN